MSLFDTSPSPRHTQNTLNGRLLSFAPEVNMKQIKLYAIFMVSRSAMACLPTPCHDIWIQEAQRIAVRLGATHRFYTAADSRLVNPGLYSPRLAVTSEFRILAGPKLHGPTTAKLQQYRVEGSSPTPLIPTSQRPKCWRWHPESQYVSVTDLRWDHLLLLWIL